jgi:hypothetical protein
MQSLSKVLTQFQSTIYLSQLITPLWPLQRWSLDIVGPLTTAQGNYKYIVVTVEYFTKWIEAKPLVNIAVAGLKRFF